MAITNKLVAEHQGMRVDYSGLLSQCRPGDAT